MEGYVHKESENKARSKSEHKHLHKEKDEIEKDYVVITMHLNKNSADEDDYESAREHLDEIMDDPTLANKATPVIKEREMKRVVGLVSSALSPIKGVGNGLFSKVKKDRESTEDLIAKGARVEAGQEEEVVMEEKLKKVTKGGKKFTEAMN